MIVVLGPTIFWVQCVCLITVLTLLVHVKQVLLVVDFATEELGKAHFVKPIFNFNVKLYSWPFKVVWRFQKVGVATGIMGNNAIKRSINFKLHFVKLRSLILRKAASFFFRKSTEMKGLGREKVWRPTA